MLTCSRCPCLLPLLRKCAFYSSFCESFQIAAAAVHRTRGPCVLPPLGGGVSCAASDLRLLPQLGRRRRRRPLGRRCHSPPGSLGRAGSPGSSRPTGVEAAAGEDRVLGDRHRSRKVELKPLGPVDCFLSTSLHFCNKSGSVCAETKGFIVNVQSFYQNSFEDRPISGSPASKMGGRSGTGPQNRYLVYFFCTDGGLVILG